MYTTCSSFVNPLGVLRFFFSIEKLRWLGGGGLLKKLGKIRETLPLPPCGAGGATSDSGSDLNFNDPSPLPYTGAKGAMIAKFN